MLKSYEAIYKNGMLQWLTPFPQHQTKALQKMNKQYRLEQLLAQMPSGYKPEEEEWGTAVGKEIW